MKQNNFDGKSLFPPPLLSLAFFGTRNFLKHRKVSLRLFSACDRQDSTENFDTSFFQTPFLSKNFLVTGFFLKHSAEEFVYEKFRCSETKHFSRKIVIPAPSLISSIFRYPKFPETQKCFSTNFSGTV